MKKLKVLIVDDSAVVRKVLTEAMASDPSIEVVGIAANGKIALAKIPVLAPDLITLDVEMPEMDGLETLSEIRKLYPTLPVIMFSTLTDRGTQITVDALALGANDYLAKPCNTGSLGATVKAIQDELIPKIKVFCKRSCPLTITTTRSDSAPASGYRLSPGVGQKPSPSGLPSRIVDASPGNPSAAWPTKPASRAFTNPSSRIDAIVIGTSTGGPNALTKVLPLLPADLPVPILIVQHMPPVFTARLAERLDQLSKLSVVEAAEGMPVLPGRAYLAPGDYHMSLQRLGTQIKIKLNQDAPENSCRPAVDVLFRSAIQTWGGNLLAVVLTGMGQDGMKGSEMIRETGGTILAQDEASSVVWGMPGAVSRAGLAHEVLPLADVPAALGRYVRQGRPASSLQTLGVSNT
ncbi:MAG: chemotaxis response regulator protein-glutamate methylesterase [Planctomycetaceae bacterium]|nr:chemotaxis response regulator protein-glutamate methylesterase [Planctomycetaceae bacterium]